jgi:hypothetical protein
VRVPRRAAPSPFRASPDRIDRAAARLVVPASFASEVCTLREPIGLVRREVQARAGSAA